VKGDIILSKFISNYTNLYSSLLDEETKKEVEKKKLKGKFIPNHNGKDYNMLTRGETYND